MSKLRIATKYGQVAGAGQDGVRVWKGIPYAKPPIGELRFKAPEPPEAWEGIKEAYTFGPRAVQPRDEAAGLFGSKDVSSSEDCLYLNIWAPEDMPEDGSGLPVMVWIHGGAFENGSGSLPLYDGSRFARRGGVIVVTLNYRLGVFGFLHLAPFGQGFASNAGLLDQAAALRWVRENIAAFGGDPSQITVFGESAGSMSIAALLVMPAAKGLFSRAILESGASQAMPHEQAAAISGGLLKLLGLSPEEADKLRELPAAELIAAGERLKQQAGNPLAMLFHPAVDGVTLPEDPLAAIRKGAARDIPLIVGTNRDEGALFIRPDSPVLSEEQVVAMLETMAGIPNGRSVAQNYAADAEGQAQIMTEAYFWRSSVLFAAAQSSYAPVWMYRFDWTLPGHPLLGKAIHAGELAFVFDNLEVLKGLGVEEQPGMRLLAERMQDAWISFARCGEPGTPDLPWPVYGEETRATLIFNEQCEIVNDPEAPKRALLGF